MSFRAPHRLQPGAKVSLSDLPTRADDFADDRDDAEREFKALRRRLADLQFRLSAAENKALLLVLQAMDCGGKDGTIRNVFRGVNPQGTRVKSFKAPSTIERSHDYLWRVHQAVPPRGMIGVFNRSHYEDVLVVRVDELVPGSRWRQRYEQINHFEQMLVDNDVHIVKCFLHLSKDEQKERLEQRLSDPDRHWKFSREDLAKRAQWDQYQEAYTEMLERTSTEAAPWHAIPADQKWYRNLAVVSLLVDELEKIDPQFPPAEKGLDKIDID